jgi:hypothetical protein
MAKKNSTKTAAALDALDEDAFAEKLMSDFDAQPAQITKEQLDKIEANFSGLSRRRSRRCALATLAMSGMQLTKAVTGDRDGALALAVARLSIGEYASHLRLFADMMESADTRIGIALCIREDMQELLLEAKAEVVNNA